MKEKRIIINTAIILIVIIIIAFIVSNFGLIDKRIPTGNIDIIDITFSDKDNNCECNCSGNSDCQCGNDNCSCKHKKETKIGKKNNSIKNTNDVNDVIDNKTNAIINNVTNDENIIEKKENNNEINNNTNTEDNSEDEEIITDDGDVDVFDNEVQYSQNTDLKIFSHSSYYVKNDLIAPGTENSYQFVIRNNNSFAIKYNLKFSEVNNYNVNMKYRLKMNGNYVGESIGRWITSEELEHLQIVLADKSYNTYTLDWKWFESDNDTQIGKNIDSNYKLNVDIAVSQYE